MTGEEFRQMQRDMARDAISSLLNNCRLRFLDAARLVQLTGSWIDRLHESYSTGSIDFTPLLPIWHQVCQHYYRERFGTSQASLFRDNDKETVDQWAKFVYQDLFANLVCEDEFVRNVLRACKLLPCLDTEEAISAMVYHVKEMDLPYGESENGGR